MARIFYVVEVHGDYTQANFFKTDKEALAYGIGEFPDFDMYDEPMEDEENEVWISGDKLEFKKGFLFSSENGHWTIDEADDASAKKEVEGFDEGFSAIYFDGFKKGAYGYLGNGIEGKGYKWSADDDGIDESKRSIPTFEEFRTSNTTVAEAKSDGTISDDEDELMDDLMGTIEAAIDDLIADSREKAYEIGGGFRGPGNVDRIKKLLVAKVKKNETINMKTLKFDEYLNEGFDAVVPTGDQFGQFALKLLAARDQAHVFHWQTDSFAQHEAFGKFYDEFLENVDLLIELIMGIKERPVFGNNACITLKDYSEGSIVEFFMHLYSVLTNEIQIVVDPMHEEVYDHARLIISQIDKLKYLLTLK